MSPYTQAELQAFQRTVCDTIRIMRQVTDSRLGPCERWQHGDVTHGEMERSLWSMLSMLDDHRRALIKLLHTMHVPELLPPLERSADDT